MSSDVGTEPDTTAADLAEALTNLARFAAHQQHHPDNARWVRAHAQIDDMLTLWQIANA